MRLPCASDAFAKNCMATSSSRVASLAGVRAMERGGTAADACVAMAAVLAVVEPTSTGLGGDVFCLFWSERDRRVFAVNGSGRSPHGLDMDFLEQNGIAIKGCRMADSCHAANVTVPGACAAWVDVVARHGRLGLPELLAPAIAMAEDGFVVSPVTAHLWARSEELLREKGATGLLDGGQAPIVGSVFRNPRLARVLSAVAQGGRRAFYEGEIAEAMVRTVRRHGGALTMDDLREHMSTFEDPVSTDFAHHRVYECAPNGQGLAALIALNIVETFEWDSLTAAQQMHVMIEAMRLAFADVSYHVGDPLHISAASRCGVVEKLLDKRYAAMRASLIDLDKAGSFERGDGIRSSDTVYFCAADNEGNCCSFINSNYMGFGTGIECEGFGFTLQNRGNNFYCGTDTCHPNRLEPCKRPYHTIIPGMLTRLASDGSESLRAGFGVMGGFMQPQGHLQVLVHMLLGRLSPQEALDRPRFCVSGDGERCETVSLEDGIGDDIIASLRHKGHVVVEAKGWSRILFGRGQIIERSVNGTWVGGSDVRTDGCAIGL